MSAPLFDPDPVRDAEMAAQWWTENYVGRRRAVEQDTAWCPDPIGHDRDWRSSELRFWEESRGIYRSERGICNQCGRRMP